MDLTRAAALTLGLTTFAACSHQQQQSKPTPNPADAVASSSNAPQPPADREARVYVDARILEACGLNLPQAFFPFDSSRLGSDDEQELQDVAQCLVDGELAEASVTLVGHTDPRGGENYNEALSQRRAEAVMEYFETHGVEDDRMEIVALGEEVASEDADDWPADRRVDVRLMGEV